MMLQIQKQGIIVMSNNLFQLLFSILEEGESFIRKQDWQGLEILGFESCSRLSGSMIAEEIQSVDLSYYQASLHDGISLALHRATTETAKAIYFEYDLDNHWQSAFFICTTYHPRSFEDDDWACEYSSYFQSVGQPEFGRLYQPGFSTSEFTVGVNTFLILRTIAAFGRAYTEGSITTIPICMGFHDQSNVTRINVDD